MKVFSFVVVQRQCIVRRAGCSRSFMHLSPFLNLLMLSLISFLRWMGRRPVPGAFGDDEDCCLPVLSYRACIIGVMKAYLCRKKLRPKAINRDWQGLAGTKILQKRMTVGNGSRGYQALRSTDDSTDLFEESPQKISLCSFVIVINI